MKKIHGAQLNWGGSNAHNKTVNERMTPVKATRVKTLLIVGNFSLNITPLIAKKKATIRTNKNRINEKGFCLNMVSGSSFPLFEI